MLISLVRKASTVPLQLRLKYRVFRGFHTFNDLNCALRRDDLVEVHGAAPLYSCIVCAPPVCDIDR